MSRDYRHRTVTGFAVRVLIALATAGASQSAAASTAKMTSQMVCEARYLVVGLVTKSSAASRIHNDAADAPAYDRIRYGRVTLTLKISSILRAPAGPLTDTAQQPRVGDEVTLQWQWLPRSPNVGRDALEYGPYLELDAPEGNGLSVAAVSKQLVGREYIIGAYDWSAVVGSPVGWPMSRQARILEFLRMCTTEVTK